MPLPQSPETRALQHLLLQGFTLYTSEAAAALRAVGSTTLDNPDHAHVILLGEGMVQCFWGGMQLLIPLEVSETRFVRVRLETAVTMQLAPPPDNLQAFPDEMIRAEVKKRGLTAPRSGEGPQ